MIHEELISECKQALRVCDSVFDSEVEGLVNIAYSDLALSGIKVDRNSINPLIAQAVIFYCKANFGFRNDSEKFRAAYENLKKALSIVSISKRQENKE